MPKNKARSVWLREWIKRIDGNSIYTTDGKVIFCEACQQQAPSTQFFQLNQHNQTEKHTANVQSHAAKQHLRRQQFLTTANNAPDEFSLDLCDAMISANIPFWKLTNNTFRSFLEKYCGKNVPSRSTLANSYLHLCFEKAMARIKQKIGSSYIWASVDETTDIVGRYVANLIVGKLDPSGYCSPNLVSVKMLEKTNHSTVARFVNDGLRKLGISEDKLLLLLTDSASYMLKAGEGLKLFYPNMIHCTCVCHALHRTAEEIRSNCHEVDSLIANTKKVFAKAPSRIAIFKEMCPLLPLPPQPILTRWCTWIHAAVYYSENFSSVKNVIECFDTFDAISIQKSKNQFSNPIVAQQLAFIHSNYSILASSINELETQGLALPRSVAILSAVKIAISKIGGAVGARVDAKFDATLKRNPGIGQLVDIAKVIDGETNSIDMAPDMIAAFKYAAITSCEVERSFSIYKNVLSENRTSFTPDNLEMYLICNCEAKD